MKKVLIIDALNMFFRCYACDPSIAVSGNPAGGCIGFLKSLQKSIRVTQPDDVIIVWDGPGGSRKRRTINKNYKLGRKVVHLPKDMNISLDANEEMRNKIWQQTRLLEYLESLPVCQFMFEDVEADDVISAIVQSNELQDWKKVILSNDRDFMQLCDEDTILVRPAMKPWEILNTNRILEQFEIHPVNMALARAIAGDKSDNLPGVPNVGLKRAVKFFPLLSENLEYSVQDIINSCEESLRKKKNKTLQTVLDYKEEIHNNYRIMQLYQPSISYQNKQKVYDCLSEREKLFNMTRFRMLLIEDGFISIKWNILESTMRRIVEI